MPVKNNGEISFVFLCIVGIVIFLLFVLADVLPDALDLSLSWRTTVFTNLLIWGVVFLVFIYLKMLKLVWPALLGFFYLSLRPGIEKWGTYERGAETHLEWWATGEFFFYTMFFGVWGLYLIKYLRQKLK